ncbi:hypothetical protein [Actinomadura vinacea]
MPALAEEFTVVAADLRGLGASDKPAGQGPAVRRARTATPAVSQAA